jgi:hypothetical protein
MDFSLVLATITTSLTNFMKDSDTGLEMMDVQGGGLTTTDWDSTPSEAESSVPEFEEGQGLKRVLAAFTALRQEFDTKFKAMWA